MNKLTVRHIFPFLISNMKNTKSRHVRFTQKIETEWFVQFAFSLHLKMVQCYRVISKNTLNPFV